MSARSFVIGTMSVLAACGGNPRPAVSPATEPPPPRLEATVGMQAWYRAAASCGQGPYEIEVPVANGRWGEEFELRLATPRRIAITAVIEADGTEVAKAAGVYARDGREGGKAENARCVADARERLAASRGGGGGGTPGGGTPVTPPPGGSVRTPDEPPPAVSVTSQLELVEGLEPPSIEIVRFGWREREGRRAQRVRVRFWSVDPNDLADVWFGVVRVEWRPNVPEADYDAYLVRIAEAERLREEERRRRLEEERVRREEEDRRRREEQERRRRQAEEEYRRRPRVAVEAPKPPPPPRQPTAAELELEAKLRLERQRRMEEDRRRALEEERERARREEERRRRREAERAREEERKRRREAFCASHPEDRGCWGAGGMRVHLDLQRRREEHAAYCASTPDDARCWTSSERARRTIVWQRRIDFALLPPKEPDGPPPAALAETVPPKLSVNATWRNGYWHWTGSDWAWLAGMWRVPEEDIESEQTTTAPDAPPPLQPETPPPPPMAATIWVTGFWQWSGTSWVWVAGSWQARPGAGMSWRPAQWKPKGAAHVLVPGGWVRVRAGGR